MKISQGLYETITSKNITDEQRFEAIRLFTYPVHHLDGENEGYMEPLQLSEEDAELIIQAIKDGNLIFKPEGESKNA